MVAKSNKSKNMKNTARGHRTGNGSETLRMDDTGEEEDDMEVGWTKIEGRSGKKETKKRKKGKEDGSESSSVASEEEGDGRNRSNSGLRVILKFKEVVGISGINPLVLTYELRKLVGEIEFAKVLQDGALLIACMNEEQKNKSYKIKSSGKTGGDEL